MPRFDSDPSRYEVFLKAFSRDRDRIFLYVQSLLPHRADAEDVFQRCSILLWRKFETFDQSRPFLPWACGVAFYEVRNFLRVASRDRLQFDDDLIRQLAEKRVDSLTETDERFEALRGCLEILNKPDRELVHAAYDDLQSLAEVAESSGRALQTVYNRLSVLRRKLLECVQRKMETKGGLA